ncbi:unnamed protein product [Thlaspi arvense]|uniref:F-box domain-containing protein n=1 Tax=Thlaspi arvense TaxID=13288 RepID=A0AAU9T2R2_THLAR|nr:unnamed protein product [Thlaspi arvense]
MAFSFDLAVTEERCKNHHEATREEIPFDIVIEILTRLPPKSLMRFKSVSELWSSFICSQYFTNRFLKASPSPPRLYMWLCVDNNKNVLLSSSSASTVLSFVVDQDLTIPAMEGYSVSQVFRGLMCFTKGARAKIFNTSTRQLVILPDIEESNKWRYIKYHIGHDHVHDQYKVVCTVSRRSDEAGEFITFLSEHWVLILGGGDGSSRWRKIPSRCPPHQALTQAVTINGRMHYLAWVRLYHPVLVTFDVDSEEISILEGIRNFPSFVINTGVVEYGGRVAVLRHMYLKDKAEMDLWVMEDEEKNTWSHKTVVSHHPSHMHMVNSISLRVQGTTRNGEVIFVPQNVTRTGNTVTGAKNTTLFHVFLYNLERNRMRKVKIKETSNRYLTKKWDVVGFDDTENLMYL